MREQAADADHAGLVAETGGADFNRFGDPCLPVDVMLHGGKKLPHQGIVRHTAADDDPVRVIGMHQAHRERGPVTQAAVSHRHRHRIATRRVPE